MKEIKIISLHIENFMGVKEKTINFNCNDAKIIGENSTGKSTIADAWSWLLFHKNSRNQSTQKFNIKPINQETGEVKHGLDTMVKATLQINDSQLTLKKVYSEVWRKKRGSNEKQFDGHTTDYYISGSPVKKKEYENEIKQLAEENIFRLLTDPLYFNEELHWQDRREVLLQMKNVSDEEVIEENEDLAELEEVLTEKDLERHKKSLKSKMKKLNDDIQEIPTRIDETNNNLPNVSGLDGEKIKSDIEDLKEKKSKKEQELNQIKNGGQIAELKKQKTEIEADLQEIKNKYKTEYEDKIQDKKENLNSVKDKISELERKINNEKSEIEDRENIIEKKEKRMEELRKKWQEVNDKTFDEDQKFCPTCDQKLPEDQIQEKREKFNQNKAEELEDINQQGKEEKEKVEKLQEEIKEKKEQISNYEDKLENLQEEKENIESEINDLQEKVNQYKQSDEYQEKLEEKENLKNKIKQMKNGDKFSTQTKEKEIEKIEEQIDSLKDDLSDIKQHEKGQQRIEELKEKEEELSKKYEELEREMYLCEQFEKERAELLEEKVNELFDMAEFRLFEKQINGGIKPTCKTTYNGIPFNTGLNTGTRIKVGLDIIETLAEHFEFRAPVFVDNAEAITHNLESESQLIKLIAQEGQENLKVEVE